MVGMERDFNSNLNHTPMKFSGIPMNTPTEFLQEYPWNPVIQAILSLHTYHQDTGDIFAWEEFLITR